MPPKKPRTPPSPRQRPWAKSNPIPLPYRLFFLYIEPVSALTGAYYALFQPHAYLHLTHAASTFAASKTAQHISTTTALSQLANLYLLFALSEALVLRATADLKVWRALLFGLAVADVGHLLSVARTGSAWDVYAAFWAWNAMGWGNVGFVYLGLGMRCAFLAGVGVG